MPFSAVATNVALPEEIQIEKQRPRPPAHLSKEEKDEWAKIVNRMPPDWFSAETLPILESMVCQIRTLRLTEACLRDINQKNIENNPRAKTEFHRLARLQDASNKTIGFLATKMRLTHQSKYDVMAAARADKKRGGDNPWDEK